MITTTTTICPAQPCDQTVETDCIIYNGNECETIGITNGMTVTEVVDIILDNLNLINCTTTLPPTCRCYLLISTLNAGSGYITNINYIDCNNTTQIVQLADNQRKYICCKTFLTDLSSLSWINFGWVSLICRVADDTCTTRNSSSICYSLTATGIVGQTVSFQYIDSTGTKQTDSISVGDPELKICAWEDSIDKTNGSGTLVITEAGICDTIGGCP
jgi:hypothetical protein